MENKLIRFKCQNQKKTLSSHFQSGVGARRDQAGCCVMRGRGMGRRERRQQRLCQEHRIGIN
jgi:hypothetical protein